MSSQHDKKESVDNTNNHLRKTAMDPLHEIGHLSSLNPGNRSYGPALSTAYLQQPAPGGVPYRSAVPPPIPPRTQAAYRNAAMDRYRYPGMNSYCSPYSARYSPGMYTSGLYSSPYSNYRMPYGQFGAPNNAYSSFLQMAEESTRPAFESIESVVQVASSISMMLESTYGAVHSSYSAILGVVDQFSRLKDHLTSTFSIFAMLRGLQWLCLKVLYLLGLSKNNPDVEEAWNTARMAAASGIYPDEPGRGSAWPFFMFLSLVIGAPWLMFKLLSKNVAKKAVDPRTFFTADGRYYHAPAAYDFTAAQPGELSIRAGEKLLILPQDLKTMADGQQVTWVTVCNQQKEIGMVPLSYLKLYFKSAAEGRSRVVGTPNSAPYNATNTGVPDLEARRTNIAAPSNFGAPSSQYHSHVPLNAESNSSVPCQDVPAQYQKEAIPSEETVVEPSVETLKDKIKPKDLSNIPSVNEKKQE